MNKTDYSKIAALFDLDGVVLDTESQYTDFWEKIGVEFLKKTGFGSLIKGQTLNNIFETYFPNKDFHKKITESLNNFELNMSLPYIPGAKDFIQGIKKHGIKVALVTSSNQNKMQSVYKKLPDFASMFDKILTAEMFARGKPAPDCYLLGAKLFNLEVEKCVVFEDSFHGLQAGFSAGMKVIGLTTTNPKEKIQHLTHMVIKDFTNLDITLIDQVL
ncbi:MAG: HAD family hydrolase [Spirochaetaceae bacterium]|nr:HAD family hydrolase [Spirochaetaceae bacterium]MBO5236883.1 HAD family hydrolase [Spirochaetaceae bacterium]